MATQIEWRLLEGFDYLGNFIFENPVTGELAWEDREYLVMLPPVVERQIHERRRSGRQTDR